MSGEERSGLKHVELQKNLQEVEQQKCPLWVSDQRIVLVQTDEYSVYQDNHVVYDHKHTETNKNKQVKYLA